MYHYSATGSEFMSLNLSWKTLLRGWSSNLVSGSRSGHQDINCAAWYIGGIGIVNVTQTYSVQPCKGSTHKCSTKILETSY